MDKGVKSVTHLDALRHFRWIQPYDYVAALILMGGLVFSIRMSWASSLLYSLLTVNFTALWGVCVLFRCSFFILQQMARCKTLPDRTAQLTLSYLQQQPPPSEDQEQEPYLINAAKFTVLRRLGWVKPIDYLIVILIIVGWVTAGVSLWNHRVDIVGVALTSSVVMSGVWCVIMAFRCGWFVLQLGSDLRDVPAQAIKLVLTFERRV
jgi:hypothetical protein